MSVSSSEMLSWIPGSAIHKPATPILMCMLIDAPQKERHIRNQNGYTTLLSEGPQERRNRSGHMTLAGWIPRA